MNILVTGGTGFIGTYLVEALTKKGHKVKVITRDSKKAKKIAKEGAMIVAGDLGETKFLEKELKGVDIIYHLAAIPGDFWGITRKEYQKVNFTYTQNLITAARTNKVKRFIFCSSIQAANPVTPYGESKLLSEAAVKKSGLDYVIVRPGVVYGPGEKKSILKFCQIAKKGFFPMPGGGNSRLAIIFIDDLISLFLKSLDRNFRNRTFWAIGDEVSLKKFLGAINKELGTSCRIIPLPASAMKVLALPFEGISALTKTHPPFTRKQVNFMTFDWHFKRSGLERGFWQPRVSLKEGIGKTVAWYQKEGIL